MTDEQNIQDNDMQQNNGPAASGNDEATHNASQQQPSNAEKDPKDWVTGDEDATAAQKSYLGTMADEAGESVPDEITKAEASQKIEELQDKTGRG